MKRPTNPDEFDEAKRKAEFGRGWGAKFAQRVSNAFGSSQEPTYEIAEIVADFRDAYRQHATQPSFTLHGVSRSNGHTVWDVREAAKRQPPSSFKKARLGQRSAQHAYDRAMWANSSLLINPVVSTIVECLIRTKRVVTFGGIPIEEASLVVGEPLPPIAIRKGGKMFPLDATCATPLLALRKGERWTKFDAGAPEDVPSPEVSVFELEKEGERIPTSVALFRGYEVLGTALDAAIEDALTAPQRRRKAARNKKKRERRKQTLKARKAGAAEAAQ